MEIQVTIDLVTMPGSFFIIDDDIKKINDWVSVFQEIEEKHSRIFYKKENDRELTEEEIRLRERIMLG